MQATVTFVKMAGADQGERKEWTTFNFETADEFTKLRSRMLHEALKSTRRVFAGSPGLYRGPEGDLWLTEVTVRPHGALA